MSIDQTDLDQAAGDETAGDEPDEGVAEPGADGGEEPPDPPPELGAGAVPPDPVRDRLLLPLLLPILAIAAVALYVLNISRVFLAGAGAASVVVAAIVTVAILAGAAVISAMPQLRSSTLTMTVALLVVIVIGAGMVTLGPSEPHEEGGGGYQEPAGQPTATLAVTAGPGLTFGQDQFTTPGGILEIDYVDEGASHTLVFEEPQFSGFELAVPQGPQSLKVEIEAGEYTIYCDLPGHRAGGMEAVLTVTPPPPGAEPAPGGEGQPGREGEPAPTEAP